jgi:hypothetical protein
MIEGFAARSMLDSERGMVLANWKHELAAQRLDRKWSRGLTERDFWCLVNHAVDRITLPSCEVFVGVHANDPETPVCWAAVRRIPVLLQHEIVFSYARESVRNDPELAVTLERALLSEIQQHRPLAVERRAYNPFLELRR